MNPLTPGVKTSEFKVVLLAIVGVFLTAAVSQGVVTQSDADTVTKLLSTIADGISAVLALAYLGSTYFNGRTQLKTALINQGLVEKPVVQPAPETPVQVVTPDSVPVAAPMAA